MSAPKRVVVQPPVGREKSTILLEKFPISHRFQCLEEDEISKIPWIADQQNKGMAGIIVPEMRRANTVILPDLKSEEDLDGLQEDPGATPEMAKHRFNNNVMMDINPIPIIESAARKDQLGKFAYPYTQRPFPMYFLHLKGVNMSKRMNGIHTMELFIYHDKPLTENVHFECEGSSSTSITSFQRNFDSLMLPFIADPNVMLVALLYMNDIKETNDVLASGPPFAIGHSKIMEPRENEEELPMNWVLFKSGMSLQDHLKSADEGGLTVIKTIDISFNVEIHHQGDPKRTCRLTSCDAMFPSQLLTVYDIRMEMDKKFVSKDSHIFVGITLRKPSADGKGKEDPVIAAIKSTGTEKTELGYTSPVPQEGRVSFLEQLHLMLDPEKTDPLTLVVNVYKEKKGKVSMIFSAPTTITKVHEMHRIKLEKKGGAYIRFNTMYPLVCCPTPSIRPVILCQEDGNVQDPMYSTIVPYIVEKMIAMHNLPGCNFRKLFNCFMTADVGLQTWIEHYFAPEDGFAMVFTSKVTDNLDAIVSHPMPFFMLIFKAMIVEDVFDFEFIENLFKAVAKRKDRTLLKSCSDLLIQLQMQFDNKRVHKLTYMFINSLDNSNRMFIFNYIFSDMPFIESLTFHSVSLSDRPMSPYLPVLSLYFSSLNSCFMENKTDTSIAAIKSLCMLATTIETYGDHDSYPIFAAHFFPIISIVFTFFDSICERVNDVSSLAPIMLFLMKYCHKEQCGVYFKMLSHDNRLRFFDFLMKFVDTSVIENLAASLESMTVLSTSYEMTSRMCRFINFLDLVTDASDDVVTAVFKLLTEMLNVGHQANESFPIIFSRMAHFVVLFKEKIFVEKTRLIIDIITPVVLITQRNLMAARNEATGFILWMLEREKKETGNFTRSDIALQYAIFNTLLEKGGKELIPFWKYLPPKVERPKIVYNKVIEALKVEGIYETKVRAFINLLAEFKNFPSVRALLYKYIVSLNEKNNDRAPAFVAQWRLSALIADVFRAKKQIIKGIPTNGIEGFKFIHDEPPVDISVYSEDSGYLVMESPMFTELSLSNSLQESMRLCQWSSLHWIVGDITAILFDFLEKHRQFSILKNLYEQITKSFVDLQKDEHSQLQFARILCSGPTAEKFQANEIIQCYPYNGYLDYVVKTHKIMVGIKSVEDDGKPIMVPNKESMCQICRVKADPDEMKQLNARTFSTMFVHEEDVGWNETKVTKYVFKTEVPVPSCVSLAKVIDHATSDITKAEYYETKLKRFLDKLRVIVDNIEHVLPPPKMAKEWANSVAGVTALPIIKCVRKFFKPIPEHEHQYYILAKRYILGHREQIPDSIVVLITEIKELMIHAMGVIAATKMIVQLQPREETEVAEFRKILGMHP